MIAILDTSSLMALVQYYLPFDKNGNLLGFIEQKFDVDELIITDKVYEEMRRMRGGILLDKLPFLDKGQYCTKTNEIIPPTTFFNLLENQFVDNNVRKKLNDVEFEVHKNNYIDSADFGLLLVANKFRSDGPILVTEEQPWGNDGKCFKKIPLNSKTLRIDTCDLPTLLSNHYGFTGTSLFS